MNTAFHKNKKTIVIEKDNQESVKIEADNYIIYLNKDKNNTFILITISENSNKNDINFKRKFLDFSLIDNYFSKFKGKIDLIFKFLERILICNLFCIKRNNGNLILTLFCLEENKEKNIDILLPNIENGVDFDNKEKNQIIEYDVNSNNRRKIQNFGAAPISKANKKENINPNDPIKIFYYKAKLKNIEYFIYLNKNEYIKKNYKEIVFKIIKRKGIKSIEYFSYLNLVDFFNLSESYFSLFNYSLDDIYEDSLIILENRNFKISKNKNHLKLIMKIFSSERKMKNYYSEINIFVTKNKKERKEKDIDFKITHFKEEIQKYITKFGDSYNDEKIKRLINGSINYKNNSFINNNQSSLVNMNNDFLFINKKNNDLNNDRKSSSLNKNKSNNYININNNIIVIQKNILTISFDDIKENINRTNDENKTLIKKLKHENDSIYLDDEHYNNISLNEKDEHEKFPSINPNKDNIANIDENKNEIKLYFGSIEKNTFMNKKRNLNHLNHSFQNLHNDHISFSYFYSKLLNKREKINESSILLNINQLNLILDRLKKVFPEFRLVNLKIKKKLIYDIIINSKEGNNNSQLIIKNFYEKSKNNKNLIFLIKTNKNKIFGGFTQFGFNLENSIKSLNIDDSNSFVFSIDKMKIYDLAKNNNFCIFCNNDSLPEFKEQIMFDKNNILYGFTGKKNKGFLVDEDYILNDGEKLFYIKQIQVISLYSF